MFTDDELIRLFFCMLLCDPAEFEASIYRSKCFRLEQELEDLKKKHRANSCS